MSRRRNVSRQLREARERKYRLQAKGTKFIPAADSDFARMVRRFADHVTKNALRLGVAAEQLGKLEEATEAYRDALADTMRPTSAGPRATKIKNTSRKNLEAIVRAVARTLRACEALTNLDRMSLNMTERPERLQARVCPQVAPTLRFIEATAVGTHVLEYGNDFDHLSNARPHGAARLELFVGLVKPPYQGRVGDGSIPAHPAQLSGGPLWYLRSHSTSRFEVEFPVLNDGSPMLVCYWGRWADARGGVGPFSKTCVARVESGSAYLLHEAVYLDGRKPESGMSRRIEAKTLDLMEMPTYAVQCQQPLSLPHAAAARQLEGAVMSNDDDADHAPGLATC